jgi:hypothetical protein
VIQLPDDVRARIETLLRDGDGDQSIARETGVSTRQVRNIRDALRIARLPRGSLPSPSLEALFYRRVAPTPDGHMLWPDNPSQHRAIRRAGRNYSVNQVAFRIGRGREPEGMVLTGCDVPRCVHPKHVEDENDRALYRALTGEVAS